MPKKNLVKLLGIAFGVAVLSTGLFYTLVVGRLSHASGANSVVVAARKLEPGVVLKESDLKLRVRADAADLKGTYTSPAQVAGFTLAEEIGENEPVTQPRLAPTDPKAAAARRIPQGFRAVSIHVTDSGGVLALLQPAHRVDIHVVGVTGGRQTEAAELRTLLQNVEVLSVGQAEARSGGQNVTVLVSPAEAELLALADSALKVRLALRNPSDKGVAASRRLALVNVFGAPAEHPVLAGAQPATPHRDAAVARRVVAARSPASGSAEGDAVEMVRP